MKARQQPVTQAGSTFTINNHKGEKKKQPFNCSFKVKYNEKQVDKEWTDTYREWFKLCHSTFSGDLTIPSGWLWTKKSEQWLHHTLSHFLETWQSLKKQTWHTKPLKRVFYPSILESIQKWGISVELCRKLTRGHCARMWAHQTYKKENTNKKNMHNWWTINECGVPTWTGSRYVWYKEENLCFVSAFS